jgi:hypothetical protein
MGTVRLTMAQALVRFLSAQATEVDGRQVPLFGGVWAIFGHGNVAGFGEALHAAQDRLPTFRAQAMAHAAIAFAKAHARRRMMVCTTRGLDRSVRQATTVPAHDSPRRLGQSARDLVVLTNSPGPRHHEKAEDQAHESADKHGVHQLASGHQIVPLCRVSERIGRAARVPARSRRKVRVGMEVLRCRHGNAKRRMGNRVRVGTTRHAGPDDRISGRPFDGSATAVLGSRKWFRGRKAPLVRAEWHLHQNVSGTRRPPSGMWYDWPRCRPPRRPRP